MEPTQQPDPVNTKGKSPKAGWVWAVIIVLVIIGVTFPKGSSTQSSTTSQPTTTATDSAAPQPKAETPSVAPEYISALAQADTYANTMHLSKQGVYDQLVSEYGGKFTPEAAQYGIDNVKADWNANALAEAKTYQNDMHLSPAAVRDQLVSSYGGKFTQAEADYAMQHIND